MTPLRMLACLAHPDDEAFTASGVLAASTAQGVQVRLVCATYGEEGDIRQPGIATRETLGQVRHQELRRSCAALGVQEPIMLGYRDSGWGDAPAQYHPQAFVQALPWQVVGRLVRRPPDRPAGPAKARASSATSRSYRTRTTTRC